MEDDMKAMSQYVAITVVLSAALVGCSSAPSKPQGDSATQDGVDWKRVSAIESAARHAGVDVHWVNYPRKTDQ
jgi:hypothetical protein